MAGTETRTVAVNLTANATKLKAELASARTSTTQYQQAVKAAQGQLEAMQRVHARAKLPPLKPGTEGYEKAMRDARAEVDKLTAAQKRQEAELERTSKAAEKAQQRVERWRRIGQVAQVAGVAVAAGLWKATQAASDLDESVSKSGVVFGEAADRVQAWSATAADAFGQSQRQALEAAGTFGNLFTSMGFGSDQSADMSMKLVQLASDLASFNNIDPTEALDALRSGLVGETEPMRRLGVNMNEATLRAEALALGLDASTSTLTPAVKAQAAYSLILKQTKNAQGDFTRTADGLANSQRTAKARFEDAAAALGDALVPVMADAAKAISALLGWFNDLPGPVKTAVTWLTAVGGAAAVLAPKLVAVGSAIKTVDAAVKGSTLAGTAGAGTLAGGLTAVIGAAAGMTYGLHQAGAKVSEVTGLSRDLMAVLANLPLNALAPGAGTAMEGLLVQLGLVEDRFANLPDTWRTNATEFAGFMARLQAGEGDMQVFLKGLHEGKTAAQAFAEATGQAGESARKTSIGVGAVAEAAGHIPTAAERAADALGRMRDRFDENTDAASTFSDTLDALFARQDVGVAVERWKGKLAELRKAVRGGLSWEEIQGYSQSWRTVSDAMVKNGATVRQVMARYDAMREQMRRALAAVGVHGKDAERILDRTFGKRRQVKVALDEAGVRHAQSAIDSVHGKTVAIDVKLIGANIGAIIRGAWASGGRVAGPGTATSDSIPARLSDGEYVVNARSAAAFGYDRLEAINRLAAGGRVQRLARGGRGRVGGTRTRDEAGGGPDTATLARDLAAAAKAAADKRWQQWTDRLAAAKDKLAGIRADADQLRDSIEANVNASTRLSDAFDLDSQAGAAKTLADAQDQVADAVDRVHEAQQALNEGSPAQRADAVKQLADAERDLADARRQQAQAEQAARAAAPTPANVVAGMQAQAKAAADYAAKIRSLTRRGLSLDLITELAGTDVDAAKPMLDTLARMTDAQLRQVNAAEAAQQAAAKLVAGGVATAKYGAAIGAAQRDVAKVQAAQPATAAEVLATQALRKQTDRLNAARGVNGKTLAANTREGRANRDVLATEVDLIKTAALRTYERVKASKGEQAAQEAANAVVRDHARRLLDSAEAAGFNRAAVKQLADQLGVLPGNVHVNWESPGLADAALGAQQLANLITNIPASRSTSYSAAGVGDAVGDAARVKKAIDDVPATRSTRLTATDDTATGIQSAAQHLHDNWESRPKVDRKIGADTFGLGIEVSAGAKYLTDNWQNAASKRRKIGAETFGLGTEISAGGTYLTQNWANKPAILRGIGATPAPNLAQQLAAVRKRILQGIANLGANVNVIFRWGHAPSGWHATGGLVTGPGTGTSDSIDARLSAGEYVVKAAAVRRLGVARMAVINRGQLPGYAAGGPVAARPAPAAAAAAPVVITGGVPVVLQLDSRQVWQGQLDLQRRTGNTWQLVAR